MKRMPLAAFSALAVATIGAFFVTQHLKVTTPLLAGTRVPAPVPGGQLLNPPVIDPLDSRCDTTAIAFHPLHRADAVSVYVVSSRGAVIRALARAVPLAVNQDQTFTWNGREQDGQPAPAGAYHYRVDLIHQRRAIDPLVDQTNDDPIIVTVKGSCPEP